MMIQYAGSSYWSRDIRLESRGSIAYKLHRTFKQHSQNEGLVFHFSLWYNNKVKL